MCYKESICDSLADVPVFLEHHGITVRTEFIPAMVMANSWWRSHA
ncbi:hypothetical protein [Mesorhizobium sp. M0520]